MCPEKETELGKGVEPKSDEESVVELHPGEKEVWENLVLQNNLKGS